LLWSVDAATAATTATATKVQIAARDPERCDSDQQNEAKWLGHGLAPLSKRCASR
jgi:hypothetical protein